MWTCLSIYDLWIEEGCELILVGEWSFEKTTKSLIFKAHLGRSIHLSKLHFPFKVYQIALENAIRITIKHPQITEKNKQSKKLLKW
jgi:hypothetical protein